MTIVRASIVGTCIAICFAVASRIDQQSCFGAHSQPRFILPMERGR